MNNLSLAILLAIAISAPSFLAQSKPEAQNPQRKKTSPEKTALPSSPSEKEKLVKQDEAGKPDATDVPAPTSREEMLATSVTLAHSIGTQADVDDPLDKIRISLESAKLLINIKPSDSFYIVAQAADLLLERKKKEKNQDGQAKIASIERELIALFSKLDPAKTEKFIQDSLDAAENTGKQNADNSSATPKARAEKMAELASVLIDNGIPAGVDLLLNSVAETGRVANAFVRPFRTAVLDSAMKEIMSARIGRFFSGKIIADSNELSILAAPVVGITGRDDSYSAINTAILELELNSLRHIEATLRAAREQERPVPYTNSDLGNIYRLFVSRLRSLYSKWLPERLKDVDICLQNIQELGSLKIGERSERSQAETLQEKLDKASSITNGSMRERELINLAFDVLNKSVIDERQTTDQAIDKILNALNSNESRELVKDAKIIAEIREVVKEQNFAQVTQKARLISRADWRAEILAGAASGLDKTDQLAADLLYMEALGDLNNSKPGTAVIRTAFRIAERYYEKDPGLGLRIFHSGVRFANQTKFSEKGFRFAFDRSLSVSIGATTMILGFEPERIQDALRDVNLKKMIQRDWQALYVASYTIDNKMLRYIFQLKLCEAAINEAFQHALKVQ